MEWAQVWQESLDHSALTVRQESLDHSALTAMCRGAAAQERWLDSEVPQGSHRGGGADNNKGRARNPEYKSSSTRLEALEYWGSSLIRNSTPP